MGRFQKSVARAKGAFVCAESWAVGWVNLRREKIEITTARFGTAADEFDVGICERNNTRDSKVFVQRALFDVIESNLSTERTIAEVQQVMPGTARDGTRFCSEPDNWRERGAAL